jgi:hypothetical protein
VRDAEATGAAIDGTGLPDRALAQEALVDAVDLMVWRRGVLPKMATVSGRRVKRFDPRRGEIKRTIAENPEINVHLHTFNSRDARRFSDGQIVRVLDLLSRFPTGDAELREALLDIVRQATLCALLDDVDDDAAVRLRAAEPAKLLSAISEVLAVRRAVATNGSRLAL